jgi:Lipid A 3-O-deacylase (PagL)
LGRLRFVAGLDVHVLFQVNYCGGPLTTGRFFGSLFVPRRSDRSFDGSFGPNYLAILAALCLFTPLVALSQKTETAVERNSADTATGVTTVPAVRQPVESEIAETNLISYGSRKLFGAAERCNLWTAGVEYDRHIWGYHLKARMDYVVEVLPFVLLSEPTVADFWGNPKSPYQQLVHGVGLSPFGFRMLWRSNKAIKPYLIGKAGGIAFPKKVLSTDATYVNFAFQGDFGVQIRLTQRVELRLDPLEYFHFSNGYLAASNPGFDELGAKFGISYRLGKQGQ